MAGDFVPSSVIGGWAPDCCELQLHEAEAQNPGRATSPLNHSERTVRTGRLRLSPINVRLAPQFDAVRWVAADDTHSFPHWPGLLPAGAQLGDGVRRLALERSSELGAKTSSCEESWRRAKGQMVVAVNSRQGFFGDPDIIRKRESARPSPNRHARVASRHAHFYVALPAGRHGEDREGRRRAGRGRAG